MNPRQKKKAILGLLARRVRKRILATKPYIVNGHTLRRASVCRESFVRKDVPIHLVDQVFKQMAREGLIYGHPIRMWEGPKNFLIRKRELLNY